MVHTPQPARSRSPFGTTPLSDPNRGNRPVQPTKNGRVLGAMASRLRSWIGRAHYVVKLRDDYSRASPSGLGERADSTNNTTGNPKLSHTETGPRSEFDNDKAPLQRATRGPQTCCEVGTPG